MSQKFAVKRGPSFVRMRDLVYHNGIRAAERLPPLAPLLMPLNKIIAAQRADNDNGVAQPSSAFESSRRTESFEILYTFPARGVFTGSARALWNIGLGTSSCWLLPIAKTIVDTQDRGVLGLVTGPCTGLGYGLALWWIACTTASMQLLTGSINTLLSPIQKHVYLRSWHRGEGRWAARTAVADPWLLTQPSNEAMLESASERQAKMNGRKATVPGISSPHRKYYQVLAIEPTASADDIKRAYRHRAKILHPDRNPSPTAEADFDELKVAYNVLSNPESKLRYDAGGEAAVNRIKVNMRATLKNIFGGPTLAELTGDPLHQRHCRLAIEDIWYASHEATVVDMRMHEVMAQNLLKWLHGYKLHDAEAISQWHQDVWDRFPDMTNTGLGKEVMYVVGESLKEGLRFTAHTSAIGRALHIAENAYKRNFRLRAPAALSAAAAASKKLSSEEFTINVLWRIAIADIQQNVFEACVSVCVDQHQSVTDEERNRRKIAVGRLAELLIEGGQPYSAADRNTLERIAAAVRQFQQAQSKKHGTHGGCSGHS